MTIQTNGNEFCRFRKWWKEPEQSELRKSCAEGWGWIIWQAALSSKQDEA